MIEVTCNACGNANRVAEDDVPVGAKYVNCASCKARVPLPTSVTMSDLPPPKHAHQPIELLDARATRGSAPPPRATRDSVELPAPRARPAGGPGAPLDLELMPPDLGAELPAPKTAAPRTSTLDQARAGVSDLPAPKLARGDRSGPASNPLARAHEDAELPAPKPRASLDRSGPTAAKPAPPTSASTAPILDLPAPRPGGVADLPAPRGAKPAAPAPVLDLPRPAGGKRGAAADGPILDLPAPAPEPPPSRSTKPAAGPIVDLPAPRPSAAPKASARPPVAKSGDDLIDFPTPRKPAPVAMSGDDLVDFPSPRGKAPARALGDDVAVRPAAQAPRPPAAPNAMFDIDLPTPKGPGGLSDLPTPKGPSLSNLPTPKHATTDVTPKRDGIVELPQPKPGGIGELPAPKGFFDDLPQPAAAKPPELPAPKGFFDDLPGNAATAPTVDIAPKGFFEDLPGKPIKPQVPEVPAPKGFFEDLPGKPSANRPEVPAPKGFFEDLPRRSNKPAVPEPPAPKGFFEDLPQPGKATPQPPAPKGFFENLPGAPKPSGKPAGSQPLELELDDSAPPLDLDTGSGIGLALDGGEPAPPALQPSQRTREPSPAPIKIATPAGKPPEPAPASASSFDDLDLSTPSAPPIRIDAPKRAPQPVPRPQAPAIPGKPEVTLELAEPIAPKRAAPRREKVVEDPEAAARRAKRLRIVLLAVLLLGAAGVGGFKLYQNHVAKQEAQQKVSDEVRDARKALGASDATHWDRAAGAARRALEIDERHPEALGIAAEALIASGLANGTNADVKFAGARRYIATAVEVGLSGPQLRRAQALSAITTSQGDRAVEILQPLVAAAPKDATLALYLGWAQAARGAAPEAITAFDQAVALGSDAIKLYGLYGRGRAKLANADLQGARDDFAAILELEKGHIGAQVGLAAAMPASQSKQQEADLLALLALPDLDKTDPRAVVQAWNLAADAAKRGNRLDVARERYRKALVLVPNDIPTMTGLADVELRDAKLDAAADLLKKALDISKDDLHAQLVQSELSIARKDLADAKARLDALASKQPPPPAIDRARIQYVVGKLLEAQGDDLGAAKVWEEAGKLAGDSDLTPTLAAATKLGAIADKSDPAQAQALRAQADALLSTLQDNAQKDPQLALTLGTAYLQAADPAKAEPWLRRAVEARPSDADAQYQLAKATARLGRIDEAITRFQQAIEADPARTELALELARTYEVAKRDTDAAALYAKLLAGKDPSVQARARAGRFYARTHQIDEAAEQGDAILAADPNHPAGMYLRAEGLLVKERLEEARKLFTTAADIDRDPAYLDGQGRAAEAQAKKDNHDARLYENALRAYDGAIKSDLALFSSEVEREKILVSAYAGRARILAHGNKHAEAVLDFKKAAELRPGDATIAFLAGKSFVALRRFDEATQWLERAVQLKGTPDASWELGQLYENANRAGDAARAYETATRLGSELEKKQGFPVSWLTSAYYRLGNALKQAGRECGAKRPWQIYLDRNPADPKPMIDGVRAELNTGLRACP